MTKAMTKAQLSAQNGLRDAPGQEAAPEIRGQRSAVKSKKLQWSEWDPPSTVGYGATGERSRSCGTARVAASERGQRASFKVGSRRRDRNRKAETGTRKTSADFQNPHSLTD